MFKDADLCFLSSLRKRKIFDECLSVIQGPVDCNS